jgi:hypothetical protein
VFGRHVFVGIRAGHPLKQEATSRISGACSRTGLPAFEEGGCRVEAKFALLFESSVAGVTVALQQGFNGTQVVGCAATRNGEKSAQNTDQKEDTVLNAGRYLHRNNIWTLRDPKR